LVREACPCWHRPGAGLSHIDHYVGAEQDQRQIDDVVGLIFSQNFHKLSLSGGSGGGPP
jgi:hypothetical protein